MNGITHFAEWFGVETGGLNVVKGGERGINKLCSCSDYALQGLAAGSGVGTVLHRDTASQGTLNDASEKGAHDDNSNSSQYAEEAETLLSLFGQRCGVPVPVGHAHQGTWHC